ncbi:hypothetical protein HPGCJGGD_2390 [Methylobacterium haplocladii]|nr:hypothetical protein HPGCJGGD_2390 [Methylobacterium haplocladii]
MGDRCDHVEAVEEVGHELGLDALRLDCAELRRAEADHHRDRRIVAHEIERRHGQEVALADGLELEADLDLFALVRLECATGDHVRPDLRLERGRIGDIRSETEVEIVDRRDTAGQRLIASPGAGGRGEAVVDVALGEVLTQAADQAQIVGQLDLVLGVEADLAEGIDVDEIGRSPSRDLAVDRIDDAQGRDGIEVREVRALVVVQGVVLVIDAEDHVVQEQAVRETGLGLVVDLEQADLRLRGELVAGKLRLRRVGIAGLTDVGVLGTVAERVAEVLADGPSLVEGVLELVAGKSLLALERVDPRVSDIERAVDAQAAGIGAHGAGIGQEVRGDGRGIALVARQDREGGARIRPVGDRRRDIEAIGIGTVDLRAALTADTGEAIEPVSRIVGRAAEIEGAVDLPEGAAADLDIAERHRRRPLGDLVDQAAGIAGAEQYGGRAAQHLDALQPEGLDLEGAETVVQQLQAILVDAVVAGDEAAQREIVDALVGAEGAGIDTRRVLRGLGQGGGALRLDLLAADHRDRLRGLDQRRVGLGRGGGAGGDVAVDRPLRVLARDPAVGAGAGHGPGSAADAAAVDGPDAVGLTLDRDLVEPGGALRVDLCDRQGADPGEQHGEPCRPAMTARADERCPWIHTHDSLHRRAQTPAFGRATRRARCLFRIMIRC